MFSGDVFWINVETGNEDSHTVCHPSGVTAIEAARDGSMLLTSTSIMPPLSSVWRLRETQEHVYDLPQEQKVKFANLNHEKIIGTAAENGKATVYFVTVSVFQFISFRFTTPKRAEHYVFIDTTRKLQYLDIRKMQLVSLLTTL